MKKVRRRGYYVTISEDDGIKVEGPAWDCKPSRAILKILKRHFLHMDTSDDQSIYTCAPRDNAQALIRYLREAKIFATVEPLPDPRFYWNARI